MNEVIRVRNLLFRYPRSDFLLQAQHLDFHAGQVYVIQGKNGSGKTTLSKLLCGILKPNEGSVEVFGKATRVMTLGEIGEQVGYLFQEPSMQLFTATVKDEMTFVSDFLGEESAAVRERSDQLLSLFQLDHLKERSIYRLSRGEKQRLALAAILMSRPKFLILDEPTTGLDQHNRHILYEMIGRLVFQGIGLAIVSHSKELQYRYRGQGVLVCRGEAVAYGPES